MRPDPARNRKAGPRARATDTRPKESSRVRPRSRARPRPSLRGSGRPGARAVEQIRIHAPHCAPSVQLPAAGTFVNGSVASRLRPGGAREQGVGGCPGRRPPDSTATGRRRRPPPNVDVRAREAVPALAVCIAREKNDFAAAAGARPASLRAGQGSGRRGAPAQRGPAGLRAKGAGRWRGARLRELSRGRPRKGGGGSFRIPATLSPAEPRSPPRGSAPGCPLRRDVAPGRSGPGAGAEGPKARIGPIIGPARYSESGSAGLLARPPSVTRRRAARGPRASPATLDPQEFESPQRQPSRRKTKHWIHWI